MVAGFSNAGTAMERKAKTNEKRAATAPHDASTLILFEYLVIPFHILRSLSPHPLYPPPLHPPTHSPTPYSLPRVDRVLFVSHHAHLDAVGGRQGHAINAELDLEGRVLLCKELRGWVGACVWRTTKKGGRKERRVRTTKVYCWSMSVSMTWISTKARVEPMHTRLEKPKGK